MYKSVVSAIVVSIFVIMCESAYCATYQYAYTIPSNSQPIQCFKVFDDRLLVQCETASGQLHCFNASNQSFMWSTDLGGGEYIGRSQEMYPAQLSAWQYNQLLDVFYLGIPCPEKSVVVDGATGSVLETVPMPTPLYYQLAAVDGHDVLIIASPQEIRVVNPSSIDQVYGSMSVNGYITCLEELPNDSTVFVATKSNSSVLRIDLTWPAGGVLNLTAVNSSTGEWPTAVVSLWPANEVAVVCTVDGTIEIYDSATLTYQREYIGLTHVGSVDYSNSTVFLSSYYSPGSGDSARSMCKNINVFNGSSNECVLDGSYTRSAGLLTTSSSYVVIDSGHREYVTVPHGSRFKIVAVPVDCYLYTLDMATMQMTNSHSISGGNTLLEVNSNDGQVLILSDDGSLVLSYSIP